MTSNQLRSLNITTSLSISAGLVFGALTANTSPLIIGALIDTFGISEAAAGAVITMAMIASGAMSLALARYVDRIPRRRVVVIGAVILIAIYAVASFQSGFMGVVAMLIGAGFLHGVIASVTNAVIASSTNPARLVGIGTAATIGVTAVTVILMTGAINRYGLQGAFFVLTLMYLIVFSALFWLEESLGAVANLRHERVPLGNRWAGIVCMLGFVVLVTSMSAYYGFIERLGAHKEFTLTAIGTVFATASVVAMFGSGLVALIGNRFGIIKPMIAAAILHAGLVWLAVDSQSFEMYTVGVIGEAFLWFIVMPLLFAIAAELDTHGRWASVGQGVYMISFACGPFIGGLLIARFGYDSISIINALATLAVIPVFLSVESMMAEERPVPIPAEQTTVSNGGQHVGTDL